MKAHNFYPFLLLLSISIFTSCKNSSKEVISDKAQKEDVSVKKETVTNDKNIFIIRGLQRFKEVIDNSDNKGFSEFFKFPSNKYYYVNPREAIEIFKDSVITKEYFIKNSHVPNVDYDPSLDNLLGKLDLNLLRTNDLVEESFEVENDECSYFYKIEIKGNNVELIYKSMSNPKYEDNEYTCEPESDIIYMKLEGDKLLFDQDKIEMSYEPAAG